MGEGFNLMVEPHIATKAFFYVHYLDELLPEQPIW